MFKINKIIVTFICGLFLVGCGTQDDEPAQLASSSNMPKGQLSKEIYPNHYQLDLKIIPSESEFSGKVSIDLTFTVASDHLWLHGQDLKVSKAELTLENGVTMPVSYEQLDPTGIARISFPEMVNIGDATLEISYVGKVSDALQGIYRVKDGDHHYTYTQFEAIDARRAFPGFDEPGFKVPFDVSVTVPTGQESLANSPEIDRADLGDGFTKMTFATTKPLPTYLVAFAAGPFDIVDWEAMPVTAVRDRAVNLRGIATKGKGEKMAYALDNTRRILEALEDYFQIPYPYQKLDILAVPDFAYGAMENAGAITYREQLLLLDENSSLEQKKRYMGTHAHEMAHQWFGNLVTPVWWNDIWLNESFATWMSNASLNNIMPEHKFRQSLLRGALRTMESDGLVSARQIRQPILNNDDIMNAFDGITYQKGGGVLAMIEAFMGPEQFKAGINNYMTRFAFKNATSNDFITAIGEKSDIVPMEEIRSAFNSFLEQPGVPYLDIKTTMDAGKTVISINQSRYLPLGSQGDADKLWLVPACFGYGISGVFHKYCTVLDQKSLTITLPEEGQIDYLMPNVKGAGYYRYSLDADGWSKLFNHQDKLSEEGILSMSNSFMAALNAGKIDFSSLVDVAPSLIASTSYRVATSPMGQISFMYDNVASAGAEKDKISALSQKLFGPKLAEIGFEAQSNDNGEVTSLRRSLVNHLAFTGQDKAVRAKLVAMAKSYVGLDTDGKIHEELVDGNLVSLALIVGVEDLGTDFGRRLLDMYLASNDGTVRGRFLQAASYTRDADLGASVRDLILTDKHRANEVRTSLGTQLDNKYIRDDAWGWFQANFDGVKARIPGFSQRRITTMINGYCSVDKRDEIEAFFAPRVKSIAGGERTLAQSLETIEICAAKAAFHGPKLTEYLAQ